MEPKAQLAAVSKYYGETLQSSADLLTSACCPIDSVPKHHQRILARLHPDVQTRFYGCGSPIPSHLRATTVLDLGCGTGRDAYLASALVGPRGSVIGVDMTDSQLAVARDTAAFHAKALLGPNAKSNVSFRKAFIEDLSAAGIEPASVDVVISNCVCNLSPDKTAVFSGVQRALRPGGELYFSDVYASRRLSTEAQNHPVLVAECLGGALYVNDFVEIMRKVGFQDPRVVSAAPIVLHDPELKALVPDVEFYSLTIRAFTLPELAATRENFQQVATYTPISSTSCSAADPEEDGQPDGEQDDPTAPFRLDMDNEFYPGVPTRVDANTAAILATARFADRFSISEKKQHLGTFRLAATDRPLGDILDIFRPAPPLRNAPFSDVSQNGPACPPAAQSGCCPPKPSTSNGCAPSKTPVQNGCSTPAKQNAQKGCGPSASQSTSKCCGPSANQSASKGCGPSANQSASKGCGPSANQPASSGCGPPSKQEAASASCPPPKSAAQNGCGPPSTKSILNIIPSILPDPKVTDATGPYCKPNGDCSGSDSKCC